jgi:hypothetical protein
MTPPPRLQDLIDTVQQDSPSDDLLDLLVTASSTVAQLEDTSDALLGHFVDRCRRAGRSWSEISAALGVSKQAVHKRFSGDLADRIIAASSSPPSFERFTTRARDTLVAAETAARALGRDSVGTEHLLLGLFDQPDGLAARALTAVQVSQAGVLAAVQAADAGAGPAGRTADPGTGADTRLPFARDAKTALRDALAEALELAHNYIGTEHLLLGLYRSPDAPGARILDQLGASQAEVRTRIAEMLRGYRKPAAVPES